MGSMEIYSLTPLGHALAHSYRPPKDSVRWRVIYYLAKNGQSERSELISNTGATSYTLSYLRMRKLIQGGESVPV